jgi:hypothetical protein
MERQEASLLLHDYKTQEKLGWGDGWFETKIKEMKGGGKGSLGEPAPTLVPW